MQLSNQFPDVVPPLLVNLYNSFGREFFLPVYFPLK
jgi:hypothetical protein